MSSASALAALGCGEPLITVVGAAMAKALGLTIPPSLPGRADQVIETGCVGIEALTHP
jgi:ethanolamine utilization protein EutA (predicted chaperonin)